MQLPPWVQVVVAQLTTFGLRETFAAAGCPAPEQMVLVRSGSAA